MQVGVVRRASADLVLHSRFPTGRAADVQTSQDNKLIQRHVVVKYDVFLLQTAATAFEVNGFQGAAGPRGSDLHGS